MNKQAEITDEPVRRSCLMMSDLQSGAETIEYYLAADYDALKAKYTALSQSVAERDARIAKLERGLRIALKDVHHKSWCAVMQGDKDLGCGCGYEEAHAALTPADDAKGKA